MKGKIIMMQNTVNFLANIHPVYLEKVATESPIVNVTEHYTELYYKPIEDETN